MVLSVGEIRREGGCMGGRMENGICGKEYCINVSKIRKTIDRSEE